MADAEETLVSYIREGEVNERERLLEELLLIHAAPVIRRRLRQRLGGEGAAVREDLFHEAIARLLRRLRELEEEGNAQGIEDFAAYVSRVTSNVCHDHLRLRNPGRHLLKNRIRYVIGQSPEMRMVRREAGMICELIGVCEDETGMSDEEIASVVRAGGGGPGLAEVVAAILQAGGSRMEIDRLVGIAARVNGIEDGVVELSGSDWPEAGGKAGRLSEQTGDGWPSGEERIVGEEWLEELWQAILQLPLIERRIVILSRIDAAGDDLWSLMFEAGIGGIDAVAGALEMTIMEFADLWPRIPMDAATIGLHIGVTRERVIRERYRAHQRLRSSLTGDGRGMGKMRKKGGHGGIGSRNSRLIVVWSI